jgi:hypothetical protein
MSSKQTVYYIAKTNEFNWGCGETIGEALRNAKALRNGKLKRTGKALYSPKRIPFKVNVSMNVQTDADLLTDEKLEALARMGYTMTGYKAGDRLKPFVDNYGSSIAYGEWEKVEIPEEFK